MKSTIASLTLTLALAAGAEAGTAAVWAVNDGEKVEQDDLAHPAKARASSIRTLSAAPGHGEHTDEILRWAGYSARQVKDLRASGAIGLTGP